MKLLFPASAAKACGVTERVSAVDLVEDALRLNSTGLSRHHVQVVREFSTEVPEFTVERHKVLQILINLIKNAKEACDESTQAEKLLTVRINSRDGQMDIRVMDNGVGILPENLARIFKHGFTTRANGHGFGLHSGALAAKEMGGSLTVQSEGPGKGSEFSLEQRDTDAGRQMEEGTARRGMDKDGRSRRGSATRSDAALG
jgi:C4-dicarboxylate-specific signal transduction histidine kinase